MPAVTFTTRGVLQKSALRKANERLLLNAIRQNPSISRSDLVRMTGMSPSSVTFIVNRLLRNRWVCEEPERTHSRAGRKPTALRLRPEMMLAVGVEIARSETRVILAELSGRVLQKRTLSWHQNHEILLDRVRTAAQSMIGTVDSKRVLGVGVSIPGTVHRPSDQVTAENLGWYGVPAESVLRKSLSIPIYIENNAKLSALAESWFLEPGKKPLQNFVFVTVKEGLGSGVIIDGNIFQGAWSAAAEFGHTMLYPDGRRCSCGNRGCWEQYASGDALRRLYMELSGEDEERAPGTTEIVRRARKGEEIALRALRETAHELGMGMVNLVMALNPEAIIVGHYAAEAWDLIEDIVWGVLRSRVPHYYLAGLRVFPTCHGADASILGALALVFSHFFARFEHDDSSPHLVSMHASR
jgi:predicted NBD/HSP70 family sugar kinase